MLVKKISSALVGAGFLASMAAIPALAGEVSISGEVDMHLWQYTSPESSAGTGIGFKAGSSDSYSHMYTKFDEAELKFKSKGEAGNGWKVGTEVELEIGQKDKNDFELEEASAYVDFGSVKLQGGILEDWGVDCGTAAVLTNAEDPTLSGGNEGPGFRVFVGGIDKLHLDLKLRFEAAKDSGVDISKNETRLQAKYNIGMGDVRFIYAALANKPIDSDAAGKYAESHNVMEIALALQMGQLAPFLEYMTSAETATDGAGAESEGNFVQMILGTDFSMSKAVTMTGAYLSQSYDEGGDAITLTELSVGARYKVKPAEFMLAYFSVSNNYSSVVSGAEDAKQSGIQGGMKVTF
jgi:hypothetical protein